MALMNGLVFSSYHFLLKLQLSHADAVPTISQIALAGAGCGIVSSIVTAPTELIKIRQQALLTPTTARQVARQIFREQGVRGLYRGLPVTALRDCGYGAYFAAVCFIFSTALSDSKAQCCSMNSLVGISVRPLGARMFSLKWRRKLTCFRGLLFSSRGELLV